jgi:lipid A 4'-phosphatase
MHAAVRTVLRSPAWWLFLLTVAVFVVHPGLDLTVAAWFYRPGEGFPFADLPVVRAVHEFIGVLPKVLVVLLGLFLASTWYRRHLGDQGRRRAAAFVMLLLLLGPGLAVNLMKDGWGRARPKQVTEFGGGKQFTPPYQPSDQCRRNCAFTSGHAATGFALMAPAFFVRRRRRAWLVAGVCAGLLVGSIRMAQGGHFVSDVLFSGWIVYATALALDAGMRRLWPQRPAAAGAT